MDYEKKYKKALERASKLRVQKPFDVFNQMMEYVFPELAESEDERIRKGLIEGFQQYDEEECWRDIEYLKIKDIRAWLEKLGRITSCPNTWKPSDEQVTWLYRAADEAKKKFSNETSLK